MTALVSLIEDLELRRRMGDAGRKRARELFDWRHIVQRYQELWAELADIRASAPEAVRAVPERAANPLAMDPFALFREWPSRLLGVRTLVVATPAADPALVQRMTRVKLAAPLRSLLLSDGEIGELIGHLQLGPATVEEILERLPRGSRQAGWLTVGWLCKTGLARCE